MQKLILFTLILFAASVAAAQMSGGTLTIDTTVKGSGGGVSTGGILSLTGTTGQGAAGGSLNGGTFNFRPGFWQPNFAPTSATVSVGGRVLTDAGAGLRNAIVVITGNGGVSRWTVTGSLGYYNFDEVDTGQTYIVQVQSKRYLFSPRILTVQDDLADVDFTATGVVW